MIAVLFNLTDTSKVRATEPPIVAANPSPLPIRIRHRGRGFAAMAGSTAPVGGLFGPGSCKATA